MPGDEPTVRYLFCLDNRGYPASLEVRKVYRSLHDPVASARGLIRVTDESGEDYLFPSDRFVTVELPRSAARAFAGAF